MLLSLSILTPPSTVPLPPAALPHSPHTGCCNLPLLFPCTSAVFLPSIRGEESGTFAGAAKARAKLGEASNTPIAIVGVADNHVSNRRWLGRSRAALEAAAEEEMEENGEEDPGIIQDDRDQDVADLQADGSLGQSAGFQIPIPIPGLSLSKIRGMINKMLIGGIKSCCEGIGESFVSLAGSLKKVAGGLVELLQEQGAQIANMISALLGATPTKILISMVQILRPMAKVFQIDFPDIFSGWMSSLGVIELDFLQIQSMPLACQMPMTYHTKLIQSTSGPLFVGAALCLVSKWASKRAPSISSAASNFIFILVFLVYPSTSATVFGTFICDSIQCECECTVGSDNVQLCNMTGASCGGDCGTRYLRQDYQVNCASPKHKLMELYALLMVLIYPIGTPLLYYMVMQAHRPVLDAFRRRELIGVARVNLCKLRAAPDPYREAGQWNLRSKLRVSLQMKHQATPAVGLVSAADSSEEGGVLPPKGRRPNAGAGAQGGGGGVARRRLYVRHLKQRRAKKAAGLYSSVVVGDQHIPCRSST